MSRGPWKMVMVPFGKDLSRIYPERGRGVGDDKRIRHWRGGGNSGFAEHDLETRRQRRSTEFPLEAYGNDGFRHTSREQARRHLPKLKSPSASQP